MSFLNSIAHVIARLKRGCQVIFLLLLSGLLCFSASTAAAQEVSEYRLKVAFLYNFIAYTHWPHPIDDSLTVCIHGENPFGDNLRYLQERKINDANILIRHTREIEEVFACQVIFIAKSATGNLNEILNQIGNKPILTITDSVNAIQQGVVINMTVKGEKVVFDADINAAHEKKLQLNSQLLRFANKVYQ